MSPRTLLAAAALALPALAPAAQAQTTFGLTAGLNVSDLTGDDAILGSTDPRLGFSGGVFANAPIGTSGLYVQPEVRYSMKGVSDGSAATSGGIDLDYIEVPLLLGYATPVTDSGLMVGGYVGPAVAFKVRERPDAGVDLFESTDVSAAFGVTVGAGAFGVDGRYTLGLTDAYKPDPVSLRNGTFTIGATYRFGGTGRRY